MKDGSITPNTFYNQVIPLNDAELGKKLEEYKGNLEAEVTQHIETIKAECDKYKKSQDAIKALEKFSSGRLKSVANKTKEKLKELENHQKFIESYNQQSPSSFQEYGFIKMYQDKCNTKSLVSTGPSVLVFS